MLDELISLKRVLLMLGGVILLVILLTCVIVPLFYPWTAWNCRHQDIEINSGRIRFTRYLLFMKISERIEDSELTKVLPKDVLQSVKPVWRRVNTFSLTTRHSPHFSFHGAFSQVKMLSLWWVIEKVPQPLRLVTASHLLALWQYDNFDSLAGDYLRELCLHEPKDNRDDFFKTLLTLKMPLIVTNQTTLSIAMFYPQGAPLVRSEGFYNSQIRFVLHGGRQKWYPNGRLEFYGQYRDGEMHGSRFEWDKNGILTSISTFRAGVLSEYKNKNLEQHPDFERALQMAIRDNTPLKP